MNIAIVIRKAVKILEAEGKYPVTKKVLLESIAGLMDSENGDFNEVDLVQFYRSQYTVLDFLGKVEVPQHLTMTEKVNSAQPFVDTIKVSRELWKSRSYTKPYKI